MNKNIEINGISLIFQKKYIIYGKEWEYIRHEYNFNCDYVLFFKDEKGKILEILCSDFERLAGKRVGVFLDSPFGFSKIISK